MILDMHRESPLAALQRNPFRNGPARQRAVAFEPEVVVETPRVMTLDDEARLAARLPFASERLRRAVRMPFPSIFVETHLWIVAMDATLSLPTGQKSENLPAQKDFKSGDKPVEGVERVV
jgi:hypothetical protein